MIKVDLFLAQRHICFYIRRFNLSSLQLPRLNLASYEADILRLCPLTVLRQPGAWDSIRAPQLCRELVARHSVLECTIENVLELSYTNADRWIWTFLEFMDKRVN